MTQQHPITPPPELVQQWEEDWHHSKVKHIEPEPYIATRAAQWGADQELEACCEWIADWYGHGCNEVVGNLRATRRPKPPSLKEKALVDLDTLIDDLANHGMGFKATNIRRALEQLDD